MPVAGAMDMQSFRLGNILVGNEENAAALEVTLLGPTLEVTEGEAVAAVTGAELGFKVNGAPVPNWTAVTVRAGDVLGFGSPSFGCRAYLCISGGVDVPLVMGSRSTYTRAKVGGYEGRALKKGDTLRCGEAAPLWRRCEGLVCPAELRPSQDLAPLRVCPVAGGLLHGQGLASFYRTEYAIEQRDRMGYRWTGAPEHSGRPTSSPTPSAEGCAEPGHGQPIVMLADRRATGATPRSVLCSVDTSRWRSGCEAVVSFTVALEAVELVRGARPRRAQPCGPRGAPGGEPVDRQWKRDHRGRR